MREHATIEQLLVLVNIEAMNAEFIRMELSQPDRLKKLNEICIMQLRSLTGNNTVKKLNDAVEIE